MKNQTIEQGMAKGWVIATKVYRIAKVSVIVVVTLLTLLGAYVLSTPELRDQTVDRMQGQIASPKE